MADFLVVIVVFVAAMLGLIWGLDQLHVVPGPSGSVRRPVTEQVVRPQFGFLGSAYVNVLQLNQSLAATR